MFPPKTPKEQVEILRTAFVELWKDKDFINDYVKIVKTTPILRSGAEGQDIIVALGNVRPEIRKFVVEYTDKLTAK